MAAGNLPAPGSTYGPCAAPCKHRDCTRTRADAVTPCLYCKSQIGSGRAFYAIHDPEGLAHAGCAEEVAEREARA